MRCRLRRPPPRPPLPGEFALCCGGCLSVATCSASRLRAPVPAPQCVSTSAASAGARTHTLTASRECARPLACPARTTPPPPHSQADADNGAPTLFDKIVSKQVCVDVGGGRAAHWLSACAFNQLHRRNALLHTPPFNKVTHLDTPPPQKTQPTTTHRSLRPSSTRTTQRWPSATSARRCDGARATWHRGGARAGCVCSRWQRPPLPISSPAHAWSSR